MGDSAGDSVTITNPSMEIGDRTIESNFAHVKCEIKNFSRIALEADEKRSFQFSCSNAEWVLSVFPNGEKRSHTFGEVVVYLKKMTAFNVEHTAVSEIFIMRDKGYDICKIKYRFHKTWQSCRFPIALTRSDVLRKDSGYLSFNTFTITCHLFAFTKENHEIFSTSITNNLKDEVLSENQVDGTDTLSKDFERLYSNPRFPDVILKLGKVEFPAHKVVLRSRSKVFEAMFEHEMRENLQNTVDLIDMEIDTVKNMLRYIYCGKIRELSFEDATNLYIAADRYGLEELVSKCRKILLNKLSLDNFFEASITADFHCDQLLLDAIKSLLCKNAKNILKTDRWKTFARENPILSLNLVESVILNK